MTNNDQINEYYDFSRLDYQLYNLKWSNLSMHYGLWEATTRTHRQALDNENRVLAEIAGIGPEDQVLDMGSGYGASSVWLAENISCRVMGVNINRRQVDVAEESVRSRRLGHRVTFGLADFHDLPWPDASFSVVFALESLSHSRRKGVALAEAWRVLRPGGRIVIADGFFSKDPAFLTPEEARVAKSCFDGVRVPPLDTVSVFRERLLEAGFGAVQFIDKTPGILPTARRVRRLGQILRPLGKLSAALGFRTLSPAHMDAFVNQYSAFASGLGTYGVFYAKRGERGR